MCKFGGSSGSTARATPTTTAAVRADNPGVPAPTTTTSSGPTTRPTRTARTTSRPEPAPQMPVSFIGGGVAPGSTATSAAADRPDVAPQFLKSDEDFFQAAFGQDGGEFRGESPFREVKDVNDFHRRRGGGAEVPGVQVIVENQPNAPMVGGGEPGVGEQGFGRRAMIGGDATLNLPTDPQSPAQFINTAVPAINAPSDVATDPNYVEPSPNTSVILDAAYNMPIMPGMGTIQQAFFPNDPRIAMNPGGPISRNLAAARTGYGRRFS